MIVVVLVKGASLEVCWAADTTVVELGDSLEAVDETIADDERAVATERDDKLDVTFGDEMAAPVEDGEVGEKLDGMEAEEVKERIDADREDEKLAA